VTTAADNTLLAGIVFVAALLQVTLFVSLDVAGGAADVLLLSLVAISLVRGSVVGSVVGFWGGLLVDVMTLDTLGLSALIYALVGYWAGRYGETTGRERAHAPLLAVLVGTIGIAVAGYGLHFLIGDDVSARRALFDTLVPSLALNLLLGAPVFALCRSLLRRSPAGERVTEVQLLG
jgi:rod shape-determining protein MreD